MMQKRFLAIILTLVMIFSLGAVNFSAMAQTTKPTISLETVEAKKGEDVSIKVMISNNPGLWGMDLRISYDKTAMTLTSVDNGNFFQTAEWTKGNLDAEVYTLSYEAGGFDNITTSSGVLATLNFKIGDATTAGSYDVKATYNVGDIINVEFDDLEFDIINGKVTIKADPVAVNGITLNKETLSLNTGATETLIATVSPENATNKAVSWESSNTSVAAVDNSGKVTAIKKGTATITVKTADGSFTDTCVVSVACSHSNTTDVPTETSTCIKQGNDAYTVCDDCGIVVSGSDAKLPFAGHKGGTATCKDKAVCTVCSQPYGEYAKHTLTHHTRNEADHDNAGNIEYWTCDVCNKYFDDVNGTSEITKADTVIPKVPHSHSTSWSNNSTQHWHECGCGNKIDLNNHTFDNNCDTNCNICGYTRTTTHNWNTTWSSNSNGHWKECSECGAKKDEGNHTGGNATCKDKAICVTCGNAYGNYASHSYKETVDTKYLKTAANCMSAAVYYKSCEHCGLASTTDTFTSGSKNTNNHIGGTYLENQKEADCVNKGYTGDKMCNSCKQLVEAGTETTYGNHNPASVWSTDADNHWKECKTVGCGNLIDKAPHSGGQATCVNKAICSVFSVEYGSVNAENHTGNTEIKDAVEATCTTDGYTGDTYCKDCGVKIATGTKIAAGHKTVKVEKVDATHEKDGNIEYYTCSGCDKLFSDSTATKEITLADTIIAKGEHSYGDYESDDNNHWKSCGCGNVIEKAAHTFSEWNTTKEATTTEKGSKEKVCSVCGYKAIEEIPVIKGDDTPNTDVDTDNSEIPEKSPATGDTSNIILWIALLSLSGLAIIGTSIINKRAR